MALTGAGCGFGAVEVAEHETEPGTAQVCADLVAALPEVVDDAVRRDVSPASPGVAAWGQPPIILRCGVGEPTGVDPTLAVLDVAGVGWRAVPGEGGTFFYTADRVAVVELAVPADYAPEGETLVDLAPAVLGTVPPA
ncbi:MAG: DUF3515 domain-containing protein [Jiangellales bacterium]